jgi:hypothetical protein
MVLSGPFHTRSRDRKAGDEDLATGTITLQKQNNKAQTKLIGKLDSLKLSNTLAFSNPEPVLKEGPVVAVSQKEAPAEAPVKDLTAAKVQQRTNITTTPATPTSQKVTAAASAPPTVIVSPVKDLTATKVQQQAPISTTTVSASPTSQKVNAPVKETPAVVKAPEKDLTAAKVQQHVPTSITTAPAVPTNQKVVGAVKQPAAAVETPMKDVAAAKVQQKAPANNITTPAAPTNQKVAEVPKASPVVVETPVKDPTVAKVQQQVPTSITTAPAIATNQKIISAAADIALRKTEVIRTIEFKSDSLTLVLYDNGIVDGDTVSVVLNDEVIIPKLGLTDQAYRKVIKIPPGLGDSIKLVIYAENLGSIPPNSSMLVVEEGSDRQQVGFEGDMKKSSAVILRRKN